MSFHSNQWTYDLIFHQFQGLAEIIAQDQQLQQLLKQVENLQFEKEALQENVRDAEIALRTASRYVFRK